MSGIKGQKTTKRTAVPPVYTEGFLSRLDGRCILARLLKQRLDLLVTDLGGKANLSYQKQSLCKRAIYLEARIETMETTLAEGRKVQTTEYTAAVDCLNRLYKTLGLGRYVQERRLRDILQEKPNRD